MMRKAIFTLGFSGVADWQKLLDRSYERVVGYEVKTKPTEQSKG